MIIRIRPAAWLPALLLLAACSPGAPPLETLQVQTFEPANDPRTVLVEQEPGQFLFIEINAPGTDLRVSASPGESSDHSEVKLPYLRSAPSFLCAAAPARRRTLRLEVEAIRSLGTSPIGIRIYGAGGGSRAERRRTRALAALCDGVRTVQGETPEDWADNLAALQSAGELLADSGERRLSRWARYFHAYFLYYPLSRYDQAIEEVSPLLDEVSGRGDPALEILGLQLLGQAAVVGDSDDSDSAALAKLETATAAFNRARDLAEQADNPFEIIWALNNLALAHYNQGQYVLAKSSLEQAYELVIRFPDAYLVDLTQGNRALTLEKLGEINNALGELEQVGDRQDGSTDPAERVHNLHERGRILIRLERYSEAIRSLLQAFDLAQANPQAHDIGRIQAYLGQAYREIGNFERSDFYLDQALPWLRKAEFRRGIRDACALVADNARQLGDLDRLLDARDCQLGLSPTDAEKARWHYARALDEIARGSPDAAIEHLDRSRDLAAISGEAVLRELAQLRACVLRLENGRSPPCRPADVATLARSISRQEAPRTVIEARWLWAKSLALRGDLDSAEAITAGLVDQVLAFRAALPGVLGAWYWENSSALLRFHMDLSLRAGAERTAPLKTLAALDRLLNVDMDLPSAANAPSAVVEGVSRLKDRIDVLQVSADGEARERAATRVEQSYLELAGLAEASIQPLDEGALKSALERVDGRRSLLAYYFNEREVHIWSGTSTGINKTRRDLPGDFWDLLSEIRFNLRLSHAPTLEAQLARLGELLLEPVKQDLRQEIFVLATGALTGIPLDAMILHGEPLLANHDVVNMARLDAAARRPDPEAIDFEHSRAFLAGAPALGASDLPELAGSGEEIAALAALFPAANLTVRTGPALAATVFRETAFTTADFIHIASHAEMNTRFPEISKIQLSRSERNDEEYLTPADLGGLSLNARLVVFSACNTVGQEGFAFDTGLGFLSAVFRAGAREAVVSLWPVSDRFAADIVPRFYRSLQSTRNPSAALARVKRELFADLGMAGIAQWATFQIYAQ